MNRSAGFAKNEALKSEETAYLNSLAALRPVLTTFDNAAKGEPFGQPSKGDEKPQPPGPLVPSVQNALPGLNVTVQSPETPPKGGIVNPYVAFWRLDEAPLTQEKATEILQTFERAPGYCRTVP